MHYVLGVDNDDTGKTAGSTGILTEVIMADENLGMKWLTALCNRIVAEGRYVRKMVVKMVCMYVCITKSAIIICLLTALQT